MYPLYASRFSCGTKTIFFIYWDRCKLKTRRRVKDDAGHSDGSHFKPCACVSFPLRTVTRTRNERGDQHSTPTDSGQKPSSPETQNTNETRANNVAQGEAMFRRKRDDARRQFRRTCGHRKPASGAPLAGGLGTRSEQGPRGVCTCR